MSKVMNKAPDALTSVLVTAFAVVSGAELGILQDIIDVLTTDVAELSGMGLPFIASMAAFIGVSAVAVDEHDFDTVNKVLIGTLGLLLFLLEFATPLQDVLASTPLLAYAVYGIEAIIIAGLALR